MFLDDLQWADDASLHLLQRRRRTEQGEARPAAYLSNLFTVPAALSVQ